MRPSAKRRGPAAFAGRGDAPRARFGGVLRFRRLRWRADFTTADAAAAPSGGAAPSQPLASLSADGVRVFRPLKPPPTPSEVAESLDPRVQYAKPILLGPKGSAERRGGAWGAAQQALLLRLERRPESVRVGLRGGRMPQRRRREAGGMQRRGSSRRTRATDAAAASRCRRRRGRAARAASSRRCLRRRPPPSSPGAALTTLRGSATPPRGHARRRRRRRERSTRTPVAGARRRRRRRRQARSSRPSAKARRRAPPLPAPRRRGRAATPRPRRARRRRRRRARATRLPPNRSCLA